MALTAGEVVDGKARFDGRTLRDWVPEAVRVLVPACDPVEIVLFGSVARGDDGPTSDVDLLVVVDDEQDRHALAKAAVRAVARLAPEVDPVVVTVASVTTGREVPGAVVRAALREGEVVYERPG